MIRVYVVAWQSIGGGGFDWYIKEKSANAAFIKEKVNCDELINEKWEACLMEVEVMSENTASIEIDQSIWGGDFESHPSKYSPFLNMISLKLTGVIHHAN